MAEPTRIDEPPRIDEPGLRTVALVKQVPLGGGTGALGQDGRLSREGQGTEMNPWCRRAVAQAVRLGQGAGGRSTAVTMGPPAAADVLREALACGVDDAVHVCDPALAGSDCLVTATMLAAAVAGLGEVDLILVGLSSVDGGTAAVGPMVAEILGLPFAGPVLSISLEHEGGSSVLAADVQSEYGARPARVRLPAVVSVAERSCRPAKAPAESWPAGAEIRTLTLAQLASGERSISPTRPISPTEVVRVSATASARRPTLLAAGLDVDIRQAVDLWAEREAREHGRDGSPRNRPSLPARAAAPGTRSVMVVTGQLDGARALLGEAAALADRIGGTVTAVIPPELDAGRLAGWGADDLIVVGRTSARRAAAALTSWIDGAAMPWAILGSARSWDREVLARLAVRLGAGLMSDLIQVYARDDETGAARLFGAKPSGNSAVAEIVGRGPTQIATLRTGCLDLREPRPASPFHRIRSLDVEPDDAVRTGPRRPDRDHDHDHDDYDALERASVVIGLGRGVDPAGYDEIRSLCARLGAGLAATRKVTDAGWLPHSSQVGVTGRNIAPRLYIALGMSGSTNHMVGVARAGTVLAVNSDPDAPIFAQCDIGLVADWRDAVPRLAAELERRGAVPATADHHADQKT